MVKKFYTNAKILFVIIASLALWPSFYGLKNQPSVLSTQDTEHYKAIFAAQKIGNWAVADKLLKKIDNNLLSGHVLAERYLDARYQPTERQLTNWLNNYNDLPQARDIYKLTLGKISPGGVPPQPIQTQRILAGYGSDNGHDTRFTGVDAIKWRSALSAWENGNKSGAAKLFKSLADKNKLTDWQASAAAYWTYRAYEAIGNETVAKQYLEKAAASDRTFYGIIAHKQLDLRLNFDSTPLRLAQNDLSKMRDEPAVERTIALVQMGASELAERELRHIFLSASESQKLRLLALAHELHLPSLQISMAKVMNKNDNLEFALYPVPKWKPENGFTISPDLIYAMARRESGFRANAVSPSGAQGLMQLMPKTASMMKKALSLDSNKPENDPVLNMTLGQNYVRHLLGHRMIDNNLIYMLSAYNAGPARLQEWKANMRRNDPLLFVENIPFSETRIYVMHVLTNYWIYSELSGSESHSAHALAKNQWPTYNNNDLAALVDRASRS